jgi:hypothetical protein
MHELTMPDNLAKGGLSSGTGFVHNVAWDAVVLNIYTE